MPQSSTPLESTFEALRDCYRAMDGLVDLHAVGKSAADFTLSGNKIHAHFKFCDNDLGTCDRKLIRYVMALVKAKKVASAKVPVDADESYECTSSQLSHLLRALEYATPSPNAFQGSPADRREIPIVELLSSALQSFEFDYTKATNQDDTCSIEEYANLLRVLSRKPINRRELKNQLIVSNRVLKVILRDAQELGWLTEEKDPKKRGNYLVSLTPVGESMKMEAERKLSATEKAWIDTYGSETVTDLKRGLASIVAQQELELPHHLTGYGPMDPALTGGDYLAEQEGPPFVPRRGAEWPVVKKQEDSNAQPANLPTLLSKVLMDFDIQYVRLNLGNLFFTSVALTKFKDAGIPLADAQKNLTGVATSLSGNGRSYLERHLYVVVDQKKSSVNDRMVHPAAKARHYRDTYDAAVAEVEQRWENLYGTKTIHGLRTALLKITSDRPDGFSAFPDPCQWIWNLRQKAWRAKYLAEEKSQET